KIGFYEVGSSTVPGAYSVRVFGDDAGNITSAWMKKIDETWSEAREATINYNGTTYTIVGDSTYIAGEYAGFYENPENNLTLIVQSPDEVPQGTGGKEDTDGLDLTVYVKQGFAGESKSLADELLKSTTGRIAVARKVYQSTMDRINVRIVSEQARLERQEKYLIQKFARLESTLSMINQQMAVLNA
ncbi:MAG: flagellar filament capping protein FliD, partial [Planctomycetes bacterium]|nr:flagellar filament capping protein FliD [Planctomycetota bacterium]